MPTVNGDRDFLRCLPILGPQCPDALLRLRDYTLALRKTAENANPSRLGLSEAAEEVLRCVQRELRERRADSPLDYLAAAELARARKNALEALIDLPNGGNRYAKETQARLAEGPALTICTGRPDQRLTTTTQLGEMRVTVVGCLTIFEDTTRTSGGRMWPWFCPDCRNRNGKRKPARTAERALRRRVSDWVEQNR